MLKSLSCDCFDTDTRSLAKFFYSSSTLLTFNEASNDSVAKKPKSLMKKENSHEIRFASVVFVINQSNI